MWTLLRRMLRLSFWMLLGFVLATVLLVALLRVVNPVSSGIMLFRSHQAWQAQRPFVARRCWTDLKDMGVALPMSVIAAEDQRFKDHWGFDLVELKAALSSNRTRTRGASTLSQQTAKNLFLWPTRSWLRKGLESYFTLLIESLWSKPRILEIYLNTVEFGPGLFGACAGARAHFQREAGALSAQQAAQLAAILPNPHRLRANPPDATVSAKAARIVRQVRQLDGKAYLDALH